MNKTELVAALSEKANITKKQATDFLAAYEAVITETLAEGDKIQLVGFGTYEVKERAARTGRNPRTGEEMTIPATKVPGFKAGKVLKDAVNGVQA